MSNYITIDGGTSNTRIRLICDAKISDTIKLKIGAKKCKEDINYFKNILRISIQKLLVNGEVDEKDISRILVSGMITSELGLCELAHTELPVDIEILHNCTEEKYMLDITSIPFVFLRGVKKVGDMYGLDLMRGEETEMMGIMSFCKLEECVYILPGSHTKIIQTDRQGKIIDFSTTLTGEMIFSLAKHTILQNSIDLESTELDREALINGYEYCRKEGINAALFKVRVLDTMFCKKKKELYSFFMGVVLYNEVGIILKKSTNQIVLAGKKQIRDALFELIKYKSNISVFCLSEEQIELSVPLGAIRIFEYKGE